jgi:hypothetical protein
MAHCIEHIAHVLGGLSPFSPRYNTRPDSACCGSRVSFDKCLWRFTPGLAVVANFGLNNRSPAKSMFCFGLWCKASSCTIPGSSYMARLSIGATPRYQNRLLWKTCSIWTVLFARLLCRSLDVRILDQALRTLSPGRSPNARYDRRILNAPAPEFRGNPGSLRVQ